MARNGASASSVMAFSSAALRLFVGSAQDGSIESRPVLPRRTRLSWRSVGGEAQAAPRFPTSRTDWDHDSCPKDANE